MQDDQVIRTSFQHNVLTLIYCIIEIKWQATSIRAQMLMIQAFISVRHANLVHLE
jgi:hypothetical protein